MRTLSLLTIILIIGIQGRTQSSFEHTYLTNGYSDIRGIAKDPSGGYIITGLDKNGSDATGDMYAMKISSMGEVEWHKRYGLEHEDGGNHIMLLKDGNFLISGHTNNFGTECDAYLKKIDHRGNILWTRFIGEPDDDEVAFSSVQDEDGFIYMVGRTSGNGSQQLDFFLCKLSNEGQVIYKKHFGTAQHEVAFSCIVTSDHNIVIVGYSTSELNEVNEDLYMVKCSMNGDLIWDKLIQNDGDDAFKKVLEVNGNYLVFGRKNKSDMGEQALAMCINSNGEICWEQTFGGNRKDVFNDALILPDGNIACFGYTNSYSDTAGDFFKVVIDLNGKLKSMNFYGNDASDECQRALLSNEMCCVMVGKTMDKQGNTNAYLIKTDQSNSLGTTSIPSSTSYHVYPNPFTDELIFSFNGNTDQRSIEIYNTNGQIVLKRATKKPIEVFYKDDLGKGSFYYRIKDEDSGEILNGKIDSK